MGHLMRRGDHLLRRGDHLQNSDDAACCCAPCDCANANAGRTLDIVAVASNACGICADPPTVTFTTVFAPVNTDDPCCYWDFSGGTGQAADCGPPAIRGFGFRLWLCQIDGVWTFFIRSVGATTGGVGGLDYCRPDDTDLPAPSVCTVDSFLLEASGLPGTVHTCDGPCACTYDLTISG